MKILRSNFLYNKEEDSFNSFLRSNDWYSGHIFGDLAKLNSVEEQDKILVHDNIEKTNLRWLALLM